MFLDVDLEIRARHRLDVVRDALEDHVLLLHDARERGRSILVMEVNGHGRDRAPGRTIRRWIAVLSPLRGEARRVFRASRVTASIGVDGDGAKTSVVIESADVAALAKLGVEIEVVVYRPERSARRRAAGK